MCLAAHYVNNTSEAFKLRQTLDHEYQQGLNIMLVTLFSVIAFTHFFGW
ncbi:unnamed protein product [Arabidopsis halleri]